MNNNQLVKDFSLFGKDKGISSMDLYYANKRIENSMTPYILEERQLNVTQMDIFSRLMLERILFLAGEVNDNMSVIAQAQLMFLDSLENRDITLQIHTPGGSIVSGLGIVDVMDYVKSDIQTVNMGMCASMGSILLGAGTKGKRSSLRFSRTMVHQSSSGLQGTFKDATISYNEWQKTNDLIFKLLGEYTGKTPEEVKIDADRDLWLSAEETLEYGLIDNIITKKGY